MLAVFTVGHSSLSYDEFLAQLRSADITAVADVRSSPYSRQFPQFSRDCLVPDLSRDGLAYVFLGQELGGRPARKSLYLAGVANYEAMALEPAFKQGIHRVAQGAANHRIALMCSEQDPLDCHRCLLVGRALAAYGACVRHILPDAKQTSQSDIEEKLLADYSKGNDDLFADRTEQLNMAYRRRAQRVAFNLMENILQETG